MLPPPNGGDGWPPRSLTQAAYWGGCSIGGDPPRRSPNPFPHRLPPGVPPPPAQTKCGPHSPDGEPFPDLGSVRVQADRIHLFRAAARVPIVGVPNLACPAPPFRPPPTRRPPPTATWPVPAPANGVHPVGSTPVRSQARYQGRCVSPGIPPAGVPRRSAIAYPPGCRPPRRDQRHPTGPTGHRTSASHLPPRSPPPPDPPDPTASARSSSA